MDILMLICIRERGWESNSFGWRRKGIIIGV